MNSNQQDLFRQIFKYSNVDPKISCQLCEEFIARDKSNSDIWKVYANCTKRQGLSEKCIYAVKNIIRLEGQSEQAVLYWLTMAGSASNIHEINNAINAAADIFKSPAALGVLSNISIQYDRPESALAASKKLLKAEPNSAVLWSSCGTSNQHLGQLNDAEKYFKKAISLEGPSQAHSMYMLSMLKKWTLENNNIEVLQEKIKTTPSSTHEYSSLAYSLGKEFEDIHDYERSFSWYQKGAVSVRARGDYNVDTDRQIFESLKKLSDVNGANGKESKLTPVFILGLPRTGSTLLERILSSHSVVRTFGETSAFLSSFKSVAGMAHHNPLAFIEDINSTTAFDFSSLAKMYIEKLFGPEPSAGYFIEKLPMNMYFCGVLLRAFPNAKIIYTDRSPLDTCLSNYKQIFAPNAWPYSYNLIEIAEQYILANENMNYWTSKFPNNVMRVSYEDIVTTPKESIDTILDFCNLEPEDACYNPEKNKSVSSTASSTQIRSPINKGSLHKWKKFEKHFQEVKTYLESKGVVTE